LERKDLTFDEAVSVAVTMELSEKSSEQIKTGEASTTQASIEYLKAGKKSTSKNPMEKHREHRSIERLSPASSHRRRVLSVTQKLM